jgi:hypothetical protein
MISSKRAAAVAIATGLALALVSPGLAQADDSAPTMSRAGLGLDRTSDDNEFFAGYVTKLGQKKSIVGTFTVPTLDCAGAPDSGIMSLIEIASTGGVDYADGAVFSYCQAGAPTHNPVFDISTGQIPIAEVVEDGDKIKVSSTFKGGKIKIKVQNLDQGWTATETVTGIPAQEASSLQYRFDLGDGVTLPAYDYGTLPVKGVQVGGKDLEKTNPTKYDIVVGGDPIVKPGKIKKGSFKFAYVG